MSRKGSYLLATWDLSAFPLCWLAIDLFLIFSFLPLFLSILLSEFFTCALFLYLTPPLFFTWWCISPLYGWENWRDPRKAYKVPNTRRWLVAKYREVAEIVDILLWNSSTATRKKLLLLLIVACFYRYYPNLVFFLFVFTLPPPSLPTTTFCIVVVLL